VDEKILTLHPDPGKQGVRIDRAKYDLVAQAIQDALGERGEVAFTDLMQIVKAKLNGRMQGSISWYVTTVKLDLEARAILSGWLGQNRSAYGWPNSKDPTGFQNP